MHHENYWLERYKCWRENSQDAIDFMKKKKRNVQAMLEFLKNVSIKNIHLWYYQGKVSSVCLRSDHCTNCTNTQLSSLDPWLPFKDYLPKNLIKAKIEIQRVSRILLNGMDLIGYMGQNQCDEILGIDFRRLWVLYTKTFPEPAKGA